MSRNLSDLTPEMAEKSFSIKREFDEQSPEFCSLLIYSTLRTNREQAGLFARGRGAHEIEAKARELEVEYGRADLAEIQRSVSASPGKRITRAGPGQSYHNYGLAFDSVPLKYGAPLWDLADTPDPWDKELWELYVEIGLRHWLSSGSKWRRPDWPHLEDNSIRWEVLIQQGLRVE